MAAFGAGFGGTAAFGSSTTFGQGGGWEPSPGEVVHAMVGGRQGHGGGFTGGRWVEAQVQRKGPNSQGVLVFELLFADGSTKCLGIKRLRPQDSDGFGQPPAQPQPAFGSTFGQQGRFGQRGFGQQQAGFGQQGRQAKEQMQQQAQQVQQQAQQVQQQAQHHVQQVVQQAQHVQEQAVAAQQEVQQITQVAHEQQQQLAAAGQDLASYVHQTELMLQHIEEQKQQIQALATAAAIQSTNTIVINGRGLHKTSVAFLQEAYRAYDAEAHRGYDAYAHGYTCDGCKTSRADGDLWHCTPQPGDTATTPGGGYDCCPDCAVQFMGAGPQAPAFGQRAAGFGAAALAAPASPPVSPAGTPERESGGVFSKPFTRPPPLCLDLTGDTGF